MSRRTVPKRTGINSPAEVAAWFGLTEATKANRELIVRRGELLAILEALEKARRRNTWAGRLWRWVRGSALVDLTPERVLAMQRDRQDGVT